MKTKTAKEIRKWLTLEGVLEYEKEKEMVASLTNEMREAIRNSDYRKLYQLIDAMEKEELDKLNK